jgi:hypothetical protein
MSTLQQISNTAYISMNSKFVARGKILQKHASGNREEDFEQ